mgnify:CR=1 FL=1
MSNLIYRQIGFLPSQWETLQKVAKRQCLSRQHLVRMAVKREIINAKNDETKSERTVCTG